MQIKKYIHLTKNIKFTLFSLCIWITSYYSCFIFNCDLFEKFTSFITQLEKYEIDELLIYSCIVLTGIVIDMIVSYRNAKNRLYTQQQKLLTLQATMATVQDIVGNSFNGLQGIKVKIELGETLTTEDLNTFDQIIFTTTDKIAELRSIDTVTFKNITTKHIGLKSNSN